MKKLFLFAALLLLSYLAGCASANETDREIAAETGQATAVTQNPYGDNLPDMLDFDGYTFPVLIYEGGNISEESYPNYIEIESENATTMNDAAYKRNLEVEERLNVKIRCVEEGKHDAVPGIIEKSVLADDNYFDLALLFTTSRCESLLKGEVLYDIGALPYIDGSAAYYRQDANELFRIKGKQYLLIGDFTYPIAQMVYMLFNKDIARDYNISPDTVYNQVLDGSFTSDVFIEYTKGVYTDLDGDNKAGFNDRYAFETATVMSAYVFHQWGGRNLQFAANGNIEFVIYSEKNVELLEKILELFNSPENRVSMDRFFTPFFENRALFCLYGSKISKLRDIENFDFSLVTIPKYDDKQESYGSYICGSLASVPVTIRDTERTGAIIEALYSASHRYIVDAYLQNFAEMKVLRDQESIDIFRMLVETSEYEFTRYCEPSNLLWNYKLISDLVSKNNSDLASAWAAAETNVRAAYDEYFG